MSFKTAAEIFGDGGGFGPAVPFSTSNAPGTSAGNRGIQFGEQLTAAIANRTHYALAKNDEDLNTRLASFEVGGLNAAYDLGTVGPAGAGRTVTKDAGAIESISALAALYADDHANAHFRANALGDVIDGGGGFDFVGRSGVALPTQSYGYLDRRDVVLSGGGSTLPGGIIAANLNVGGGVADSVTLGAGAFKDGGSNTDVIRLRDMVEILNGSNPGLYYISALSTTTRATLKKLDGSIPAFTANQAVNIRIFRPMFMSLSPHSGSGLSLQGSIMTGMPGAISALEIIPGAVGGRLDTLLTGGANYGLLVKARFASGTTADVMGVDGLGQIFTVASNVLLTAAQKASGFGFGNPGFYSQIPGTEAYESSIVVRVDDQINHHFGVVVSSESRGTAVFTGGSIAFTFDAPAGRIISADVTAADWFVHPDATLVEILTPLAQAGIYRVGVRDPGNGKLDLIDLGGAAVSGFPTVGAGTFRILHGVYLGDRTHDGEVPAHRSASTIEIPAQTGSAGMLFLGSMFVDQYAYRLMGAEDGIDSEKARLRTDGIHEAKGYAYLPAPTRYNNIGLSAFRLDPTGGATAVFVLGAPGSSERWTLTSDGAPIYVDLNPYIRDGMIITGVDVIALPGAIRASLSRVKASLIYEAHNWSVAATNPVNPTLVASGEDSGAASKQFLTMGAISHTVVRDSFLASRDYWLIINAGVDGGAHTTDTIYGVRIHYTDPGPRNQ